jgi:hypothetical protein
LTYPLLETISTAALLADQLSQMDETVCFPSALWLLVSKLCLVVEEETLSLTLAIDVNIAVGKVFAVDLVCSVMLLTRPHPGQTLGGVRYPLLRL